MTGLGKGIYLGLFSMMLLMGIYSHIHDVTAAGTFGKDTQFLEDITSRLPNRLKRHQFGLKDALSAQEQEMYGYTLPPKYKALEIHTSDRAEFWYMGVSPYYTAYFKGNTVRMCIGNAWIEYELEHVKTVIQQEKNQLGIEESRIADMAESVADENTLSVSDVFEAVDMTYVVDTSVLTEKLILKEPKELTRVIQKLEWDGMNPEYQEDGSIVFFNEKGDKIVQLLPPYMEDAAQNVCESVHYEIIETDSGVELHKVIDKKGLEWLQSAVYPVIIDPSMQTFEDAWQGSGLTPYGQYFKNLKEYVNPSNGLLTVTHTDLTIPGRGLDVALSRVYQTPAVFYGLTPYDYEAPPVDVGKGWQLNFPYVGDKYVHLWGGTVYKIVWSGNTFENHTGTHFTLVKNGDSTYTVTMASGTVYEFNTTGYLTKIKDLDQNSITFSYTGRNLTSITDTIGRTISLSYSDGRLWKIVYNNEEIEFSYDENGCLQWTEDFLDRRTTYYYNTGYNNWLLSKIEYPTSGYTIYQYNRFSDNDYYKYHVTTQKVFETNQVRHTVYSYTGSFSDITSSETAVKNESDIVHGFYCFVIDDGVITQRTVKTASGEPLKKFVYTHNARHEVKKVDVYNDGSNLSYTTYFAYDNWGNTIYAKNAQGHEQFFSYANTSTSGYFIDDTGTIIKQFTNAFSNCQVPSSVHTALLGMAEKQDATYVKEVYYTYDLQGHVTDTKTLFGPSTTWLTYSGTFNEYTGDTSFEIDLTGHTVTGNGVLKVTGGQSGILYEETHSKDCPSGGCSSCNWPNGNWSGKYYSVEYSYCCGKFPNYDCDEGWLSVGSFTHYPGTLGYHSSYIPNLNQKTQWFPVTTYWRAYPAQVKVNINGSAWKTISTNLKNTTAKDAVTELTNGQNTLNFSESSSYKTKFSWELYVPVDSAPEVYTTSMTYDEYGNMTSVTDTQSHTITFTYASEYSHAYMTEISATTDTETITSKATYDYNRGWVTSTQEPKGVAGSGYDTVYTYDVLGRIIKKEFPLLDGQSERSYMEAVYDCENRTVTIIDVLGHYTVKEFDKLGRLTKTNIYSGVYPSGTLYTSKTYTYQYNDLVSQVTDFGNTTTTYSYDFLGRYTEITLPASSVSYAYDDTTNKIVYTNGRGFDKICWFSWVQQLTKVEEEYAENQYAVTTYQYNESGQLTSFTDPENHTTLYEYQSLFGLTKVLYPDSSYEHYGYDTAGNVVSYTDPEGSTTHFQYDTLYRLTQVVYEDQSTVSYEYDIHSNRTKMVDNAVSVNDAVDYEYDVWNRLVRESRYLSGQEYTMEYHYDEGSRISGLLYPDGTEILYEYDDFSRITQVTQYIDGVNDEVIMNNVQYDTEGLLTQTEYGNGLTGMYSYNQSGMVSHINVHFGQTNYLNLQYTYDANNNITEQVQGWRNTSSTWDTDTVSYSYDGLDRLISASCTAWSHTYAYDKAGNRIQKDGIDYTVNVVNQVTSLSDGTVLKYDLNGNTVEKATDTDTDTYTYTYDHANRLDTVKKNGVTIGEYWYDGDGKRIKSAESTETIYIYSGLNVLYEKTSTGEAVYIYGPTGKIAKKTVTEQESHTFYYHPDHQGSTRLVTDESANVVVDAAYTPFGEPTKTGTESYLYTGKKQDETGLYYYGARYYDPELGRFLTRDLLAGQKAVSQSLNRYAYCLNNPVKLIDPAGLGVSMCNVDTGVCIRFFEDGRDGWIAYDEHGVITTSAEIEKLLDPTGKTKEKRIADQAKATYLMLLVTHPEIDRDPNSEFKLDEAANLDSDATWFTVDVKIDGETVTLKIGIYEDEEYITQEGKILYGSADVVREEGKNPTINIKMYQKAFSSLAVLFHVVGHEGQHAVDMMRDDYTDEKSAYDWNRRNNGTYPFYIPWPWIWPIPSGE